MEQDKTEKCRDVKYGAEESTENNLFSFELVVDSVSQLSVECVAPAVGFRLLDYPTVIIYHTSQTKLNNLKTISDNLSSSQYSERGEGNENIPDLKEDGDVFRFHRGKSTLFSMDFNKLFNLLSKIPVYMMLLDVWTAKTRLVGSCLLSLQTAIEEINSSIQSNTQNVPAFYSTKVSTSIFNLMGTVIGKLSGKFTLYSYGNALSKHVLEKESSKSNMDVIFNQPVTSNIPEGTHEMTSEKMAKRIQKFDKSTETTAFPQKYYEDGQKSQQPNSKSQQLKKGEIVKKKEVIAEDAKKTNNLRIIGNILEPGTSYPPPLFYNSEARDNFGSIPNENDRKQPHPSTNYHSLQVVNSPTKSNFLVKQVSDTDDVDHQILLPYERITKLTKIKHQQKANRERDILESMPRSPMAEESALNAVIKSLDEMPLLQGIMKEIIKFTISQKGLPNELSSAEGDGAHNVKCTCQQEKLSKGVLNDGLQTMGKASIPIKEKPPKRNVPKKLKFKTTKSHRLRCAMHSTTGSSKRADIEYLETNDSADEEVHPQKSVEYSKSHSDHMKDNKHQNDAKFAKAYQSPNYKEKQSRRNRDVHKITKSKRNNPDSEDLVDDESDVGHISLKSKSPVSLDIHLPSTLGSEEAEVSDGDFQSYPESLNSNSRGHTGIYSPAGLEKKWTGLDDLSKMKQSADGIVFDPSGNSGQFRSSSRLSGTDDQGFLDRDEQGSLIKWPVKSPEHYSDEFEASSNESASRKSDQSAVSRSFVASYNSESSSRSQSKRSQDEITGKQRTELSTSDEADSISRQGPERSRLSREPHSKTSSITHSIVSNRSLSRNVISNASKPVMSAHSPTTSRSLRNKARHSVATSDDMTRTVDMSTDLSFHSENENPSFSEDD